MYKLKSDETKKIDGTKIKFRVGVGLAVFSAFMLLALMTSFIPFLKYFLMGTFGLFSYAIFFVMAAIGFALINNKKYVMTAKYIAYLTCAIVCLLSIIQMFLVGGYSGTFFGFLGYNYTYQLTPGGVFVGILIAPIKYTLNNVGVYVIYSILFVVFVALIIDYLYYFEKNAKQTKPVRIIFDRKEKPEKENVEIKREKIKKKEPKKEAVPLTLDAEIIELSNEQKARQRLGLTSARPGIIEQSSNIEEKQEIQPKKFDKSKMSVREYLLSPVDITETVAFSRPRKTETPTQANINQNFENMKREENFFSNKSFYENEVKVQPVQSVASSPSKILHEEFSIRDLRRNVNSEMSYIEPEDESEETIKNVEEKIDNDIQNVNQDIVFEEPEKVVVEEEKPKPVEDFAENILKSLNANSEDKPKVNIDAEAINPQPTTRRREFANISIEESMKKQEEPKKPERRPPTRYNRPPIELLKTVINDDVQSDEEIQRKATQLEEALEIFNISAKVIRVVVGPAVTRYELEMAVGIPVKRLLGHQDDIALTLAANGGIRIEAPIPGRSAVGIEVPNDKVSMVGIKEMLTSSEYLNSKSPVTFVLGKDIGGNIKVCNLEKMPHLLVAGATNSGKSVCLNSIILSILYRASPEEVRLILVDPKRVEFTPYNGIPHLMLPKVITEPDKAINALGWAVNEMERRFGLFEQARCRNMEEYNSRDEVKNGQDEKMPYIVIIIDEVCDLMMLAKKDVEDKILRLAQKARAAGMHLVLATQRPSVNVITGTIKANFPSRISFMLTSFVDSKTILDQGGAEKLLGKGDMLYSPSDSAEPKRIQGCYVSGKEVEAVVDYIKENNEAYFDSEIEKTMTAPPRAANDSGRNGEIQFDELMPQALKYVIENGQASITMIQRKFVVGYPRAARILDQMVEAKFISPSDGSKPRSVYITMEQYNEMFGDEE